MIRSKRVKRIELELGQLVGGDSFGREEGVVQMSKISTQTGGKRLFVGADVENLYICEAKTGVVSLKKPQSTPKGGSDVERVYI
jgi:hypothetical protein